jgi:polyhydroxyalkanoate synthesis regulator phasin
MGIFDFGKKKKLLDLTKRYEQQKRESSASSLSPSGSQTSDESVSFLNNLASSSSEMQGSEGYVNVSDMEERKRKLGKRLLDITHKIEELSNQIYHLQQRVELLEKKLKVGSY